MAVREPARAAFSFSPVAFYRRFSHDRDGEFLWINLSGGGVTELTAER